MLTKGTFHVDVMFWQFIFYRNILLASIHRKYWQTIMATYCQDCRETNLRHVFD